MLREVISIPRPSRRRGRWDLKEFRSSVLGCSQTKIVRTRDERLTKQTSARISYCKRRRCGSPSLEIRTGDGPCPCRTLGDQAIEFNPWPNWIINHEIGELDTHRLV